PTPLTPFNPPQTHSLTTPTCLILPPDPSNTSNTLFIPHFPPAGGQGCTAYDVVVNSGFFRTLQSDPLYREFFLTVAMEGLAEKYGLELELTGWRVLRNRRFMGSISAQNIRARPQPHIQELEG
ncbi:PIHD1 protein, partial [Columbina picui]|nr:PIHD1 protein [Columbina picui]